MPNSPELINKIEAYLREHLTPYRCEHVLSVRDQAVSLAKRHGIDADQAELAALLHDCLKELSNEERIMIHSHAQRFIRRMIWRVFHPGIDGS